LLVLVLLLLIRFLFLLFLLIVLGLLILLLILFLLLVVFVLVLLLLLLLLLEFLEQPFHQIEIVLCIPVLGIELGRGFKVFERFFPGLDLLLGFRRVFSQVKEGVAPIVIGFFLEFEVGRVQGFAEVVGGLVELFVAVGRSTRVELVSEIVLVLLQEAFELLLGLVKISRIVFA
jgi:hypothetical protein